MPDLKVSAAYEPTGDQPRAIAELAESINRGDRNQTLLGATATGKTHTMARVIERINRPTLVIAHNKTLAAQLCNEFREYFPHNAVEYFVSYYDYYQPEAYLPSSDTYIEKDSSINDDIDRLRHAATAALFARRDVVIVASVSCIYGIGSPESYSELVLFLSVGEEKPREEILRKLVDIHYQRNDVVMGRGRFRVRGDVIEIQPANMETAYRISLFGDEVEAITHFDPMTGEVYARLDHLGVYPATHYAIEREKLEPAIARVQDELRERLAELEARGQDARGPPAALAHRVRHGDAARGRLLQRHRELLAASRRPRARHAGPLAARLLPRRLPDHHRRVAPDRAPDRRHVRGRPLAQADAGRVRVPAAVGARQPAAALRRVPRPRQPAAVRVGHAGRRSSCATRPTSPSRSSARPGLVDPEVEVRPTRRQIDDLLGEIRARAEAGERVLVTTLTKKMSEDLTDYLLESGVRTRYLHSEIDTLERIKVIRELRLGDFDVLVGVNLLREGLDLPEVSLVAILDADKEGFLRGQTALIQTIGRAARNVNGRVIMYADKMTEAIRVAIDETSRRRAIQVAYNEEHGITPESIHKGVSDIAEFLSLSSQPHVPGRRRRGAETDGMGRDEISKLVIELEEEMFAAAEELRFEYAAKLRDEIKELRRDLEATASA